MYHRLSYHFGHTRWYSYVTRLKCKLVSVCLEIVLILTHDRYMVCAKRIIGSEIILTHLVELLGDMGHMESRFGLFGDVLVPVQHRCTVCAKHTIGLEIILGARDGILGDVGHVVSCFGPFGDSVSASVR